MPTADEDKKFENKLKRNITSVQLLSYDAVPTILQRENTTRMGLQTVHGSTQQQCIAQDCRQT